MFKDIAPERWSYGDIIRLSQLGLMTGFPDGTFQPEQPVTREQLAAVISRYTFRNKIEKDVLERVLPAVVTVFHSTGLGTGFFVDPHHVVTCRHVIEGVAGGITAISDFAPNRKLEIIAKSEFHDLALLRANEANDAWLPITSKELYQGKHVAVIGSPRGYSYSVSQGVISHANRAINPVAELDAFQTDAAINPGNSGGPVIDGHGEVCGIATAKYVAIDIEGIGFAVRAEFIREFLDKNGVQV